MAMIRVLVTAAVLTVGCQPAAPAHDRVGDFGTISAIEIIHHQPSDASGDPSKCPGLRALSQKDVRAFLRHATRIDERRYSHDHFVAGDCFTEARLIFAGGRKASLGIANDAGTGMLVELPKGKTAYFLCERCSGMLDLPERRAQP